MKNGFLKLCANDWVKGLIIAVGATVVSYLLQVFNAPGFNFGNVDWSEIARIAGVSTFTYLLKNLLTTKDGSFAGVVQVEK